MPESEVIPQSELTPSKEQEPFSSHYDGLHIRLLLGGEALDPNNDKLPKVGKNQIKAFEERGSDYQFFHQASTKERQKIAGVEKDKLDEAIDQWSQKLLEALSFDFGKTFDQPKAQRWQTTLNQLLEHIGISDLSKTTKEEIREKVYNRYFKGDNKDSDLYQFIKDVLGSQNNDFNSIRQNIDVFQWFSSIFGINSSVLTTHLIAAESRFNYQPDQLISQANADTGKKDQQNNPIERRNDLNKEEKEVLEFVGEGKEIKTEIKANDDADDHKGKEEAGISQEPSKYSSESFRQLLEKLGLPLEKRFDLEILRELREILKDNSIPQAEFNIYEALITSTDSFSPENTNAVVKRVMSIIEIWKKILLEQANSQKLEDYLSNRYGNGFNRKKFKEALNFFCKYDFANIKSLADLWELYIKPELSNLGLDEKGRVISWNDISPIYFQGETFVHYRPYYLAGGHSSSDVRIYLNPSPEGMGDLIKEILNYSLDLQRQGKPGIRFKFINPETIEAQMRSDKIILYLSSEQLDDTIKVVKRLTKDHPDWFKGRETGALLLKLTDGVGLAEDPLPETAKKFYRSKERVSFTTARAQALSDAFRCLGLSELNRFLKGQPTVRMIDKNGKEFSFDALIDFSKKEIIKDLKYQDIETKINRVLQKIKEQGGDLFGQLDKKNFQVFLDELFTDREERNIAYYFIDRITSVVFRLGEENEFIQRFNPIFEQVCCYYLIDPNNLALNFLEGKK